MPQSGRRLLRGLLFSDPRPGFQSFHLHSTTPFHVLSPRALPARRTKLGQPHRRLKRRRHPHKCLATAHLGRNARLEGMPDATFHFLGQSVIHRPCGPTKKKQKQKRILVWWASSTFGVLPCRLLQETSQPTCVNICHELISQRVKLLRLSSPETDNRPITSDYVRPW